MELRDENNMPNVRSRIGVLDLDSLLESTFEREGVDAPFQYAVVYPENDSIQFEFANVGPSELVDLNFSVPVFSEFPESAELKVGFPSKDRFIIKSLGDVLAMVLVFSLLMLGTFIATLYAIVKQKRLAEVKSDFINNMTRGMNICLSVILSRKILRSIR